MCFVGDGVVEEERVVDAQEVGEIDAFLVQVFVFLGEEGSFHSREADVRVAKGEKRCDDVFDIERGFVGLFGFRCGGGGGADCHWGLLFLSLIDVLLEGGGEGDNVGTELVYYVDHVGGHEGAVEVVADDNG